MLANKVLPLLLVLGFGFLGACGQSFDGGAGPDSSQPAQAAPPTLRQAPGLCSAPDDPLCDDQDPCTADSCVEGQCWNQPILDCCAGPQDCGPDDPANCSKADCVDHHCVQTLIVGCCRNDLDCNDGNPCTKDQCDCPWGLKPGGACVCPDGEADCSRSCTWDPIEGCCWNDQQCDDGYPCNLETCVNHVCRYAPNWNLKNCCVNDSGCDDGNTCTEAYCDLDAHSCVVSLVPEQSPKCCFVDAECADDDPFTLDTCFDHRCQNKPDPGSDTCDDKNPCTTDSDDPLTGNCRHEAIPGCCRFSKDCGFPPLTDGDLCTEDRCDLWTHRCVFTPVEDCCLSSADCDDGNPCTTEACVVNTCRRVWKPGCCVSDDDCLDGNSCSIDTCQRAQPSDPSGTCAVAVKPEPGCCTNALECDDGNDLTEDSCVFYTCRNTDFGFDCCNDYDCNDGNMCTCDTCAFGVCRFVPAKLTEPWPWCDVNPLCCNSDADCLDSGKRCAPVACIDNVCAEIPAKPCRLDLPFVENFTPCPDFPAEGWRSLDLGLPTGERWACSTEGPLGPDLHLSFAGQPQETPFDTALALPTLRVRGLDFLTVQVDLAVTWVQDAADGSFSLSLVRVDELPGLTTPVPRPSFHQLWQQSLTPGQDLLLLRRFVTVPLAGQPQDLPLALRLTGDPSHGLASLDLDNLRVCPGHPPRFLEPRSTLTVAPNQPTTLRLQASDQDRDSLSFHLQKAPAFVRLGPPTVTARGQTLPVLVHAPSPDDQGTYLVLLEVNDGCLASSHRLTLTISPEEVP